MNALRRGKLRHRNGRLAQRDEMGHSQLLPMLNVTLVPRRRTKAQAASAHRDPEQLIVQLRVRKLAIMVAVSPLKLATTFTMLSATVALGRTAAFVTTLVVLAFAVALGTSRTTSPHRLPIRRRPRRTAPRSSATRCAVLTGRLRGTIPFPNPLKRTRAASAANRPLRRRPRRRKGPAVMPLTAIPAAHGQGSKDPTTAQVKASSAISKFNELRRFASRRARNQAPTHKLQNSGEMATKCNKNSCTDPMNTA